MDGCCGACVGGCTFCSSPRTWHFTHLVGSIFLDQIFDPRHTVIVIRSKQRDWWAEFGGSLISCLPHFDLMQSDQKQSTSFTLKRVPPVINTCAAASSAPETETANCEATPKKHPDTRSPAVQTIDGRGYCATLAPPAAPNLALLWSANYTGFVTATG